MKHLFTSPHLRIIAACTLVLFAGDYLYLNLLHLFGILYDREGLILGYLSMVIMFVGFYLCLTRVNKKVYNRTAPVLPLLLTGVLLSAAGTLLYLAFYNLELHVLHTYPHTELFEWERQEMLLAQKSPEEIDARMEEIRAHYFSFKAQWGVVKWYFKWGMIYTAVLILFLKIIQYYKQHKFHEKTTT